MASKSRQLPAASLHTLADLSIGEQQEGATVVPIRILARTIRPVFKKDWDPQLGPIVHDMAGLFIDRDRVPLDYCHLTTEVIGYADGLDTSSGALTAVGVLTPFKEDDRASEVIYKGKVCGVPYQASIFFDDQTCLAEEVPEGVTVTVNGAELAGPAVVIRKWSVRGIAVCPYGVDGDTALQFSATNRSVAVHFIEREPTKMATNSTEQTPPAEGTGKCSFDEFCTKMGIEDPTKLTEAGKKMVDAQWALENGETETETEVETEATVEQPPTSEEKKPVPMGSAEFAALGQAFLSEFGPQGGVMFADGLSLEQARVKFSAELREQNKVLAEKLAAAEGKLKTLRGEPGPVSFSDSTVPPPSGGDELSGRERFKASLEKKLAAGKR